MNRSENMARVARQDTKPELQVRRMLHRLGLRFRLHRANLPGTPDIVLPKHETVLFVNGCFWHSHSCPRGQPPASRQGFWIPKLTATVARDQRQHAELRRLGWRVVVVWECELRSAERLTRRLERLFYRNDYLPRPSLRPTALFNTRVCVIEECRCLSATKYPCLSN